MKHLFNTVILILTSVLSLQACIGEKNSPEFNDGIPRFKTVSIRQFNEMDEGDAFFNLKGTIDSLLDSHYSQFTLKDDTGTVTVFGLWESEGGARVYDMGGLTVGSTISIAARASKFQGMTEASKAFIYDPSLVTIWCEKTNCSIESDGGVIGMKLIANGEVSIKSNVDWIETAYDREAETLSILVKDNPSINVRVGYVSIYCGSDKKRIKIAQLEYVPELLKIKDALKKDYARTSGTISAIGDCGYILSDENSAIFVASESSRGLNIGVKMEVIGSISTSDFLTILDPDISTILEMGKVSYPEAVLLSTADCQNLTSNLSSMDGNKPGSLNLKFVQVKGELVESNGAFYLLDFKTSEFIMYASESPEFDYMSYLHKYVEIKGYLTSFKDGRLWIVPAFFNEAEIESDITIDGRFTDWEPIQGFTQDSDNMIVGLKAYVAGDNLFLYLKMKADLFTEWGDLKYFAQVYINKDLDDETGPYAWNFRGLDASGYIRMTTPTTKFREKGDGSLFYLFESGWGTAFISANKNLYDGVFYSVNDTFPCGGAIDEEFAEFEWVFPLSKLDVPRHTTVGLGARVCHEGPDTPSGSQENFFIPSSEWWQYIID